MSVKELIDELERRYGNAEVFCRDVREVLWLNRISQADLAREAGYDYANVNRWLNLRRAPSLASMLILDEALERLLEDVV